jgi:glycine/D-amino acid oxidase-like deaminating enzyme
MSFISPTGRRLYHSVMSGQASQNIVASTWTKPFTLPEKLPTSADVVIIGGGIVGVSTAWFLARQGINVVLSEKGHIAGEQSGRNWGWVRVQGRDIREVPMMLESQRIWASLADDIGEDVGFTRGGCYFTANTSKELKAFEAWVDIARDYDIPTRLINAAELRQHVRGAAIEWAGAMYTESDGRAEPHKATPAIARAAERAGARILSSCAVRGLETSAGAVSAVVTEHGTIKTSTVLCAAGAWTSMFCRSLGIDVPQLRVRGTVCRTAPCENFLDGNVFDERLGIRRREDGGYTVAHGSILEHPVTPASFRYFFKFLPALMQELKIVNLTFGREFVDEWRTPKVWALDRPSPFEATRVLNPDPSPSVLKGIRQNLDAVFPQLATTPIVEAWAGMIESSPDVVPIIDAVEQLRGFHVATGFSGHGFGIGPGAGKAIAGMLSGQDSGIDISALRLTRFFDGSPIRPQATI